MSIEAAKKLAFELRRDLGINGCSFDLLHLLQELRVEVCFEKPVGQAEALAVSIRSRDLIFVDPSLGPRRRRFTLGHELGHLLLGHGTRPCTPMGIHGLPRDPLEKAANEFAACLLLPSRLFREDVKSVHPVISELSGLADRYCVSLTATAIRYTGFTNDLCALIGVRPREVPWSCKSRRAATWWLTLPPSEGTLVAKRMNGDCDQTTARVPASEWIEDYPRRDDWCISEQVVQVTSTSWLVVLSDLPDPDDDADLTDREAEEDLEKRRQSFRRY